MKKNILLYILFTSALFIGCKKDDGFLRQSVTLDRVPLIAITKDPATATAVIAPSALSTFVGTINVKPLYASDKLPEKVDLVVIKNGDKANVKVLKAGVTVPSVVTFTGTELAALFGSVVTCDTYQVGVDIYANGKKYEAYPSSGIAVGNGGATDANQPGYSVVLNYNTKVEYNPDTYQGNFVVVTDQWNDTKPGDIIKLTKIDATHFSFDYNPTNHAGTLINSKPIIVNVNAPSLTPSITKQVIGTAWTYDPPGAAPPTARTSTSSASISTLAPCSGTLTLRMVWGEEGIEYDATFILKKQ